MMTREQKINLLSEVTLTIGNIIHTCDMGVQFTAMDSSGIWVTQTSLYRFDGMNDQISCETLQIRNLFVA